MTTTAKKEKTYLDTYFRIETGYVWGEGHTQEKRETFRNEIIPLLSGLGFEMKEPKSSGACYEGFRGKERLYCHPMHLNGEIFEESIPAIEQALEQSKVITFIRTDTYKERYDFDKETVLQLLHGKYTQKTEKLVFQSYETARRTKFISVTFQDEPIRTVDKQIGTESYQEFMQQVINNLVKQGLLIQMNSESSYYRSLNKTELKKWEKENGKVSFLS